MTKEELKLLKKSMNEFKDSNAFVAIGDCTDPGRQTKIYNLNMDPDDFVMHLGSIISYTIEDPMFFVSKLLSIVAETTKIMEKKNEYDVVH